MSLQSEVRRCGEIVEYQDFANLAIEGEMALRIGTDGAIAAVFPVIELHHFVFRGGRKTLGELVANNGLNGGFVLPLEGWLSSCDHAERRGVLSVRINGREIASGEPYPMPGGAGASLDWLSSHLAESQRTLGPGHIVLAGTPLGLYPVGQAITSPFSSTMRSGLKVRFCNGAPEALSFS